APGNSIRSLRAMSRISQPWSGPSILILSVRPFYWSGPSILILSVRPFYKAGKVSPPQVIDEYKEDVWLCRVSG
ncbi:MAG: hypothetical protein O2960_28395, partial [Verrucomicrobia bacterium]|nr:hypothetical protein [Verrucomicrobiota bacterium]